MDCLPGGSSGINITRGRALSCIEDSFGEELPFYIPLTIPNR